MDPSVEEQRAMYEDEAISNDPTLEDDPGPEEPAYLAEAGLMTADLFAVQSMVASLAVLLERGPIQGADLTQHALWLVQVRNIKRELGEVEQLASDATAERMGEHTVVLDGVGVLSRHARKSRTQWDKEMLKRDVLDSRMADETTGEILDENPVDKITAVWNLGAPRLTALRARGLDPDEYCTVEQQKGFTVEVKGQ